MSKGSYYKNKKWNDVEYYNSTVLPEVKIVQPSVYYDYRGSIQTLYHGDYYDKLLPSSERADGVKFKHDRFSRSNKGVLRGLHYDDKTWKLISCLSGSFYLVVLDIRKHSTNHGSWEGFMLSPETQTQVLIPPGFANGHYILEDNSIFYYKLAYKGEYNDVENQGTIIWNDKRYKIDWPDQNPILAKRDK